MDWSHFSRKKDLEISNTSGSHQREKNLAAAYVAPLVQADIHSFSAFSAGGTQPSPEAHAAQLTSLKEYSEQLWN